MKLSAKRSRLGTRARERGAATKRNAALDELLQIEQLRAAWNRLYQLMSPHGRAAAPNSSRPGRKKRPAF